MSSSPDSEDDGDTVSNELLLPSSSPPVVAPGPAFSRLAAAAMNPFEVRLDYKFRNPLLLAEALTHPSLAHETQRPYFDNQRLEYLGDAVIQLVFSEHLYRLYPDAAEGQLTKLRARLVSGEALRAYASKLGLGEFMMMGRGDENSGGRSRASTLADAFEALVGALFLDSGDLGVVRHFLLARAADRLAALDHQPLEVNPKGQLQEILQAIPFPEDQPSSAPRNPTYSIGAEKGPDHSKSFVAHVHWAGFELGCGEGRSKQQAESAAALDALRRGVWTTLPSRAEHA